MGANQSGGIEISGSTMGYQVNTRPCLAFSTPVNNPFPSITPIPLDTKTFKSAYRI